MEPAVFAIACFPLLAAPGPTNTLLATSGAAIGVRRSLPLLAAELSGYLLAIFLLRVLVGPLIVAVPAFGIALRIAAAIYLLHLAAKLWQHSGRQSIEASGPVTILSLFVTTLLNPKAIILTFTLLPAEAGMLAWLPALILQIVVAGSAWITVGALVQRGFRGTFHPRVGYRVSALALILLAGGLSAHVLASA